MCIGTIYYKNKDENILDILEEIRMKYNLEYNMKYRLNIYKKHEEYYNYSVISTRHFSNSFEDIEIYIKL